MLRKPSPRLALVVIDYALLLTGAASSAASVFGDPAAQAASCAAFGGSVLLFWASLWDYGAEQQALIEKSLRIKDNAVTRYVTHDARVATLILVAGMGLLGAALKAR